MSLQFQDKRRRCCVSNSSYVTTCGREASERDKSVKLERAIFGYELEILSCFSWEENHLGK